MSKRKASFSPSQKLLAATESAKRHRHKRSSVTAKRREHAPASVCWAAHPERKCVPSCRETAESKSGYCTLTPPGLCRLQSPPPSPRRPLIQQRPRRGGRVARWGHAVGTGSEGSAAPSAPPCWALCSDSRAQGRLFKNSFVRREQILFYLAVLCLMLFKL